MAYTDADYEDTTLVNIACIIGILQGKYSGANLGSDAIDELAGLGCLSDDPNYNMSNFMKYCHEMMGAEAMMGTIADLLLNKILVFDKKQFKHYIDIKPERGDEVQ